MNRKADDLSIFSGEMMCCLICGRKERSDPRIESQWRAIITDGTRYYFCPAEFPPDSGSTKYFLTAYERCFAAILKARAGEPLTEDIFRPVDW